MTVENEGVVDIISIDRSENVVLTISDHLEWHGVNDHLLTLQGKINRYLAFVESGEILESYPEAKERNIVIKVVFKFVPSGSGLEFMSKARTIVQQAGFDLRWEVLTPAES